MQIQRQRVGPYVRFQEYHRGKIVLVRIAALTIALTLAACAQSMKVAGNRIMTTQDDIFWNAVGGEENLDGYLEKLDRQLADDKVQILSRPNEALHRISIEFLETAAFTRGGFAKAVSDWYQNKYGDKLRLDNILGSSVVLIAGAPYRVDFPLGYSAATVNPLRLIESATPALFRSMSEDQITEIANLIGAHYQSAIQTGAFQAGAEHHTAAVDSIVRSPQSLNRSKLESKLSVEKAMKEWIVRKGGTIKNVHELEPLEKQAVALGMAPLLAGLLDDVRCSSGDRCGAREATLQEAVLAVQSASTIRAHISNASTR
jgi:hypothetical protein